MFETRGAQIRSSRADQQPELLSNQMKVYLGSHFLWRKSFLPGWMENLAGIQLLRTGLGHPWFKHSQPPKAKVRWNTFR